MLNERRDPIPELLKSVDENRLRADLFFLSKDPDTVLRTHTSSVQVRVMENTKPPIANPKKIPISLVQTGI